MADFSSRAESARGADSVSNQERDAKIERLLLTGLDHYFAAEYQQAINVWTRALFLDRSHARARAYIERARGALAERQRESEELLQSGVEAFERGQGTEARRLIQDALDSGAPSDEALSLLDRLDRIERVSPATSSMADGSRGPGTPQPSVRAAVPSGRRLVWRAGQIGLVSLALAGVAAIAVPGLVHLGTGPTAASVVSPAPDRVLVLPLPRRAERALARAQTLAAGGRLRDALATLEEIRLTDAEHAEADLLKGRWQRQLLEIERALTMDTRGSAR